MKRYIAKLTKGDVILHHATLETENVLTAYGRARLLWAELLPDAMGRMLHAADSVMEEIAPPSPTTGRELLLTIDIEP